MNRFNGGQPRDGDRPCGRILPLPLIHFFDGKSFDSDIKKLKKRRGI